MSAALIGMGGNVGDVKATLDAAIDEFCDGNSIRLVRRSANYLTKPWGVEDQPMFINLCLQVETELPPLKLLQRALEVETRFGRDRAREQRWGQRRLDIDLLAYDEVALDLAGLQLPHPRMKARAFVVIPLVEIAPDWRIDGETVREIAAKLDASDVQRLAD
jgi:2-amino-4-hydroxy-6-hydroxymethyldihydropteridine diphosphokinase